MEISEDTKRGLYGESLPLIKSIDDHWMSKIDVEKINLKLMNTT